MPVRSRLPWVVCRCGESPPRGTLRAVSYPSPEGGTWRAPDLGGKVAVVTGATRGVGRGIAEVLGQCGATVYVTGRSTRSSPLHEESTWSVDAAAEAVTRLGGQGIAAQCDHLDDTQVQRLFSRVKADHGQLDLLVNNVIGADMALADVWRNQFGGVWAMEVEHWDQQITTGVRSGFVASRFGLPLMMGHRSSVVFTAEWPLADSGHPDPVADLRAHASARMAFTFANQLRAHEVAVIDLVPGGVITHVRRRGVDSPWEDAHESVYYTGRAVAALVADPEVMSLTGSVVRVDECATRYGFTDITGVNPNPHARS